VTTLLTLIDGSEYSQSVCDHAAWLAGRTGATVKLIHALGRREGSGEPANLSGSIGLGARTALLEELAELDGQQAKLAQKRGWIILDEAKARLTEAGVAEVSTKLRNGDVVEAVEECEAGADWVVIGKRGEAADFAKLHLGSNLERVVRSSSKPVLVASRAFKPIERCVIAFDGGDSAMKAVEHVAANPLFAGVECRVLMVGAVAAESEQRLEVATSTLRAAGLNVQADTVPGQPSAVISDYVESADIDLLVMGAYGHSRIRNLIIGSTTTEMLRSCKIPVMLFR